MYLAGFGNHHQSEAVTGALPQNQNSPQQCAFGLFAEQLSGSAFTRQRSHNLHSWLYRKLPSVVHQDYELYQNNKPLQFAPLQAPNPYRWSPFPLPEYEIDFIDGLFHLASSKLVHAYIYQCTVSMHNRYFTNSDGEMLLVPYQGELTLCTEFGNLCIDPGKMAVIPRGVTFRVELSSPLACGYLCENTGSPLSLPELGTIGANALANPRHFLYPTASFEDYQGDLSLICKFQQQLWAAKTTVSPLNVMAWHGNYAPYCYDLSLFNTIGTVSFDHPDPSIFTVLSSDSETPGVANLDFVIFPARWMVAEHSFRPPWFHRNIMNELMGLIIGEYDARQGFLPGGVSIHNCMVAHGPDSETFNKARTEPLKPVRYKDTLAFMFETKEPWNISTDALLHISRQRDYSNCWQDFS